MMRPGSPSLIQDDAHAILLRLGVQRHQFSENGGRPTYSPIDGAEIGRVRDVTEQEAVAAIETAHRAFQIWRSVPAPRRGEFVRLIGEELRPAKPDLGHLVTLETGKILSEGLGEVQEMIDICDFAVGLSRQLHGLTIVSERPLHRMMETWHPLGVAGIISAFNFPVAVWSWNAALALVCGNACVWKPSEKTPLTALAVQALVEKAAANHGEVPQHLAQVLIGGADIGSVLASSPLVPLLSATGSTAMGRAVAPKLVHRFARPILELGGNNAAIVCPSADLELALRAVLFSAMGTAGQRCTSLRRLFVHDSLYEKFVSRLKSAYGSVTVGNPLDPHTLVCPLIDLSAFDAMKGALADAIANGGLVSGGERIEAGFGDRAVYARPALVEMPQQTGPVLRETFAPILYVMRYANLDDAIRFNNSVTQGLSSSIFTTDLREADVFLSSVGSDCGIANVNVGPSGAEIGGAFGGEKETGGGREAGSDCWKAYMRRMTSTINYGNALPLAQGVSFDIGDGLAG